MKRFSYFAVLSAAALVALAACSKEVETQQVDDNPSYNPDKNEVTAQFVLNVSTGTGATKMTEADVQADGSFRGMDKVHLLTYKLGYKADWSAGHFLYKEGDESSKATRDYDLATAMVASEITSSQSSKLFQISLPLETNAILMYGRAPRTKTKDEQGGVTAAGTVVNQTLGNVSFTLDNRLSSYEAFTQYGDLMSKILTYVMKAGRYNETTDLGFKVANDNTYWFWWPQDATSATYTDKNDQNQPLENGNTSYHSGYTFYRVSKIWRDYGIDYSKNIDDTSANDVDQKPLEEMLGEAYYRITTLRQDASDANNVKTELRAASSASVLRLASDLYQITTKVINASPTSPEDIIAQKVAEDINLKAGKWFDAENNELVWTSLSILKSNVNTLIPNVDFDTNYDKITDDFFYKTSNPAREGFPMNLGLPTGAALMKFTTTALTGSHTIEVVSYLNEIPAYGIGGGALSVQNYRYPAEIMYWTNSSIRTSDSSLDATAYPKTVTTWDNDSNWPAAWTANSKVKSTTRAVAVTKEVNYGTALLKTTVKYGAQNIKDNNSGIHPAEDDNTIDCSAANKFKILGVMIGGVDDEVGWDFLPKNNSFTKMVYDRLDANNQFFIPTYGNTSAPVYTLTWDNYNSTLAANAQSPVYVALEIQNKTGKDIWGELNLIRNDGTFYLVGKLDPTNAAAQASLPKDSNSAVDLSRANFNYPPYAADGKTVNAPRVFMQDYVTTVNFTFGENSLKHAYVTMPDLRASNVSLGLSVDLQWSTGLVFDNVILGN